MILTGNVSIIFFVNNFYEIFDKNNTNIPDTVRRI